MKDLPHMLALSCEITLQHCNKSTQVNCNLQAKKSSKMSKNLKPYSSVTYFNSVLIFNGKNVQLKEANSGFIQRVSPESLDSNVPFQRRIGKG